MRRERKKLILPLLDTLKSLPPDRMKILLSHLDDQTRDALYETITYTLSSEKVPFRKRLFLQSQLRPYRNDIRLLASRKVGSSVKKARMAQLGGGPMTHVLRTAIPLMLNTFRPRGFLPVKGRKKKKAAAAAAGTKKRKA